MKHVRRRTRLPVRPSAAAGSTANQERLALLLCGGIAAFSFAVAVRADAAPLRVLMLGLAAFAILLHFFVKIMHRSTPHGYVRFNTEGPLTFRPPGAFYGLQFAMAGLATGVGLVNLYLDPDVLAGRGRLGVLALVGVGLVWLVAQLVALRAPTGVRVDMNGVTGVRGLGKRTFTWAQLSAMTARPHGRFVALEAIDVHGRATHMGTSYHLGSDPAMVATVINFYLGRPEDHHLLMDPEHAIARAEDVIEEREAAGKLTMRSLPTPTTPRWEVSQRLQGWGADGEALPHQQAVPQARQTTGPTVTYDFSSPTESHEPITLTNGDRLEWPPPAGWWWRWPLILVVVVCSMIAVLLFLMVLMGEDPWVALVLYSVVAGAGFWVLQWHRSVRKRDA